MFYSLALALNVAVWKPMGISWFVLNPLFLGPLILASTPPPIPPRSSTAR